MQIENAVLVATYGGSWQFNARVVNSHATAGLKEFVISVTMLDCTAASQESCTVIGQNKKRITTKIPPGQGRDISENLYFESAKPNGEIRWQYQITETRG